jgi:hypothetical protein
MKYSKWHKPTIGRVKCTIDAFFPSDNNYELIFAYMCFYSCQVTKWTAPKCEVHVGEAIDLLSVLQ